MAENDTQEAKKPLKGGRKGGTRYPKINLKRALDYSKKLVSKTHTGPQPDTTILPGVFANAGPMGQVRASALKQYGLLEGATDGYKATKLAREIDAAPADDRLPLLKRAFLSSTLFKQIFETFHGDTVSRAKIEQRAKGLDVHPDLAAECTQFFVDSAVTAGLGILDGDSIRLESVGSSTQEAASPTSEGIHDDEEVQTNSNSEEEHDGRISTTGADVNKQGAEQKHDAKPVVTLSLTVDPSSDPDKLEKQLKLLRQYGVI